MLTFSAQKAHKNSAGAPGKFLGTYFTGTLKKLALQTYELVIWIVDICHPDNKSWGAKIRCNTWGAKQLQLHG